MNKRADCYSRVEYHSQELFSEYTERKQDDCASGAVAANTALLGRGRKKKTKEYCRRVRVTNFRALGGERGRGTK